MRITLSPLTNVAFEIIEELNNSVNAVFHCPTEIKTSSSDLVQAYNAQRRQYLSSELLVSLNKAKRDADERIVGIVDVDLYTPGLDFVFGEADVISGIAIVSLYRLKQEYYGLPPDKALFLTRASKEIVHEIGHTFGLKHCTDTKCVMHFSNCLADTDWKETNFCSKCCPQLEFLIQ